MLERTAAAARVMGVGMLALMAIPMAPQSAQASRHSGYAHYQGYGRSYAYGGGGGRRWHGGFLQCVAFARADSGIQIAGNASEWWYNAAGVYQRGSRPEVGAVLSFSATGRMRLGHVAVVSGVLNGREILVDHANWYGNRGGVARGVSVVDVSPNNDWSAVRVALGYGAEFGSVYPTHGFIYSRAEAGGSAIASNTPAPMPALNPPPADLRPAVTFGNYSFTGGNGYDEVAEAPAEGFRSHAWRGYGFRHYSHASGYARYGYHRVSYGRVAINHTRARHHG